MTKEQAISAIYRGEMVDCTIEEYPEVRSGIQEQAGKWIEGGDPIRASIALQEVKRLDTKFDHYFFESEVADIGKKIVLEGLKKGIFEKGEKGAIIFKGEHTRVFVNSEGLATYEAKDLALPGVKYTYFKYDISVISLVSIIALMSVYSAIRRRIVFIVIFSVNLKTLFIPVIYSPFVKSIKVFFPLSKPIHG